MTSQPARRKVAGAAAYREVERGVRARLWEVLGEMSLAGFADAVQLNHESVRRALRGGTITTELVVRACARFNVSADWLLFRVGSKHGTGVPVLLELKRPDAAMESADVDRDRGTSPCPRV